MENLLAFLNVGCLVAAFVLITLPITASNDVFFKPVMTLIGVGAVLAFIGTVVY